MKHQVLSWLLPVTLTCAFALSVAIGPTQVFADPTLSSAQTVGNVVSVPETKASLTLTIATAPVTATSITIGNCVISFATTTAGVPGSDTNSCATANTATIRTATGAGDIARSKAQIATALIAIGTSATSTLHSTLAITASSTDNTSLVVKTSGTEVGAGAIEFTDGTSGKVTSSYSILGVVPVSAVAQKVTFTPATVGSNQTYTYSATINANTYSYSSNGGSIAQIVSGLASAMSGDTAVSCTQDGTAVTCTSQSAGTSFTYSSSATLVAVSVTNGAAGSTHGGGGGGGGGWSPAPTAAGVTQTMDQQKAAMIVTIKTQIASLINQLIGLLSAQIAQMQSAGAH